MQFWHLISSKFVCCCFQSFYSFKRNTENLRCVDKAEVSQGQAGLCFFVPRRAIFVEAKVAQEHSDFICCANRCLRIQLIEAFYEAFCRKTIDFFENCTFDFTYFAYLLYRVFMQAEVLWRALILVELQHSVFTFMFCMFSFVFWQWNCSPKVFKEISNKGQVWIQQMFFKRISGVSLK